MNAQELKNKRRIKRKRHIRKSIIGSEDRLRMTVFRSLNHIYVQLVNDEDHQTIVSASSIDKEVRGLLKPEMSKSKMSAIVGETFAKRALEKNIKKVAFDRNGYLYHGRIKALAEAARKGGLEF